MKWVDNGSARANLPHVGKDRFVFQGKESLTPSPCGEGFVERDSYAVRVEEKA